ncbi:MAG: DUF6531 domain-containing protein, partial [Acidobacteria bacterium]|nr:DUF6531 domain-containing protein [Acidobacteriota bacterium]
MLSCALAVPAGAQTPFNHKGFDAPHGTYSPLPGEHIDPASGSLSLVATDLVLPGNAGLDLRVQRVYHSGIYPDYANGGSTALEEDSWAGIGWRLHFGRVINPTVAQSGATQIEMGDGGRHALYTTTAHPEGWMTKGFWVYDRATHTLKLPNGVVYTFGHSVYLNERLGTVRYVTEIRDPFNNRLTFSYFTADGPPDGVSQIQQYLSATQIRTVSFTYDPTLKALATMTYDGRTWTYEQTGGGPAGFNLLTGVRPPVGPKWNYAYDPVRPGELTTLTAPSGGTSTFTYFDIYRRAGPLSILSRVVITRVTGGWNVTAGTWNFQYGTGPNEDTTKVICPCGTTTYRFLGTGLTGDFSAWSAGALAEQTVEQSYDLLERRTFTWRRSEPISPDPVPGQSGIWTDAAVYAALPEQQAVTRGSHTATTTFEYHTTDFNDYGQPWRIRQYGDFAKRIDRSFQHAFGPYIVGRVLSEWAWVGAQGIELTRRTYDSITGFVTSAYDPGHARSFEPTPAGNVGVAIDALGNRTTFGYDWGVVREVRSPENVVTTSVVNPNGTIASTTTGTSPTTLTTTYLYDEAFRVRTIQGPPPPPNHTHPVTYEYDNVSGQWVRTNRWDTTVQTNLDGFGRARYTEIAGLKTHVARDACGRVTFESAPYTTGEGTRGVTTVYDALSRPVRVTDGTGAVTQYAYSGVDVTVTDAEGR